MSSPHNQHPSPSSSSSGSSLPNTTPNPHPSHSPPSSSNPTPSDVPHGHNHNPNPLFPPYPTSSSALHPLLPPVSPTSQGVLAAEVDPYADYRASYAEEQKSTLSAVPEKCLTFCSQRADAPPMCRMFCLRRRQVVLDRKEELARLRPKRTTITDITSTAGSSTASTSSTSDNPSSSWNWSIIDSFRKRIEPYSFIYIRGTPDGVVGRYMEEMEFDDGQHDFGNVSRVASTAVKRKREEVKMQWIDWGDHGSLLHLPFTSLFYPILSIPTTLSRLFTPSIKLLAKYQSSFEDGTQTRALEKLTHEIQSGGALQMLGKIRGHWEKRVKEREEELERERMQKVGKEVEKEE